MIETIKDFLDTSPIELFKVRFDKEEYPTFILCNKKDLLEEIRKFNGGDVYSSRKIRDIEVIK